MKTIYIYPDHNPKVRPGRFLPLNQVEKHVEGGADVIHTHCIDFFCFDYLDKGYDAIIMAKEGYIVMSDLLKEGHGYCEKHIRRAHNIRKMYRAGFFEGRHKPYSEHWHPSMYQFGGCHIGRTFCMDEHGFGLAVSDVMKSRKPMYFFTWVNRYYHNEYAVYVPIREEDGQIYLGEPVIPTSTEDFLLDHFPHVVLEDMGYSYVEAPTMRQALNKIRKEPI